MVFPTASSQRFTLTKLQRFKNFLVLLWVILLCGGCSQTITPLEINQQYPSENRNDRIRFVVIHYTAGNWEASLNILTTPSAQPVSAHYLIPESGDISYPAAKPLTIYQLVPEQQRAWHAGESSWEDRKGLNDHSIGIELVNQSWCETKTSQLLVTADICIIRDYDPAQMQLLLMLLKDIVARNPDITPTRILGHSDIVPHRKQDPGSRFPWQWLATNGVGAWYDDDTMLKYFQQLTRLPEIKTVQNALRVYGYGIAVTGHHDSQSKDYLLAFQRHFVPENLTGELDLKTVAVLWALLEKYFPQALQQHQLQLLPQPATIKPV